MRHPGSRDDLAGIEAEVERAGQRLVVRFTLTGPIKALRIPEARSPGFTDGLWRHTCCEMFIARPGTAAYHEFNFSPSGEWALYGFSDYRNGGPLAGPVPVIRTRTGDQALRLEAEVQWPPGKLLLGLSAVVEAGDAALSYWALRHAPGKPDFHRREAFALELE